MYISWCLWRPVCLHVGHLNRGLYSLFADTLCSDTVDGLVDSTITLCSDTVDGLVDSTITLCSDTVDGLVDSTITLCCDAVGRLVDSTMTLCSCSECGSTSAVVVCISALVH